jgi:hypothetical protein
MPRHLGDGAVTSGYDDEITRFLQRIRELLLPGGLIADRITSSLEPPGELLATGTLVAGSRVMHQGHALWHKLAAHSEKEEPAAAIKPEFYRCEGKVS